MIKKEVKESIIEYSKINTKYSDKEIEANIDLFEQALTISKEVDEFSDIEEHLNEAYASDETKPSLKLFDFEAFCKLMVYIVYNDFYEKNTETSSNGKRIISLKKCISKLGILDNDVLNDLTVKDENGRIIVYPRDDVNHPMNKYRGHKDIDIISSITLRNELAHSSTKMTDFDYYWYYTCLITSIFKICNKYKVNIIRYFLLKNDYAKRCISKYEEEIEKGYNYIPVRINPKLGHPIFNDIKDEMLVSDIHKNKDFKVVKIIGYAGVGKSSLLEYMRYNELKSYIASPNRNRISLIIPMINVSDKETSIIDLIASTLNVTLDTARMFIKEDKLNLYFDGINEIRISGEKDKDYFLTKLETFINEYEGDGYIIVTDRDSNDLSILNDYKVVPTIIIKDFSDEEVQNYILKNIPSERYKEVNEKMEEYKKNNKGFYQELKKPFYLHQFVSLILNDDVIPTNDMEITSQVLKNLVRREEIEKKSHIAKYVLKGLRYVLKNTDLDETFYIDYDDLNILLNKYKNEVLDDKDAYTSSELISLMEKLGIIKEAENSLGGIIFTEESYYYALLGDI
ncbi:MAG: hypothetical protein IKJ43_05030 [Bacilli bacterium]|nr:hypothetical protein [Bacilli bacterium]